MLFTKQSSMHFEFQETRPTFGSPSSKGILSILSYLSVYCGYSAIAILPRIETGLVNEGWGVFLIVWYHYRNWGVLSTLRFSTSRKSLPTTYWNTLYLQVNYLPHTIELLRMLTS